MTQANALRKAADAVATKFMLYAMLQPSGVIGWPDLQQEADGTGRLTGNDRVLVHISPKTIDVLTAMSKQDPKIRGSVR